MKYYMNFLVITSSGFWLFSIQSNVVFTILLFAQTAASVSFWLNPIENRNTIIHQIDNRLAITNIASLIAYKWWLNTNNNPLFFGSTAIMTWYFYQSNYYSRISWCSNEHIKAHFMAHLACYLCLYLAFL
jgi:hypothetical protein